MLIRRTILALSLAAWLLTPQAPAQQDEHDSGAAVDAHGDPAAHGAGSGQGATAAHDGAGHEAPPPLLPDPGARETQLAALWVVIIFIVLLVVLYPTAWKSVLTGLKAREARIRKDIAEAEAARARAEGTLREYNQQLATAEGRVREMLSTAQTDAERIAANIRAHAQQEAEEAKERATRDIESAKNQALTEIYEQTATLATGVAEKILRRNLNADDQRDLVKSSLEQMQSVRA